MFIQKIVMNILINKPTNNKLKIIHNDRRIINNK